MPCRAPLTAAFDETVLAAELPRHVLAGHMRFRNFTLLAEGGKAQVFRCVDANLGREAALKVLHRRLAPLPVEQQMLIREARIMAALRHAAIPEVYDLGRDPDGRPYFAMSLRIGRTLHEILTAVRCGETAVLRAFDLQRLVDLLLQVAAALEYAHRLNVVHCDLKPENIIVDSAGAAHLVDWGLAIVEDYAHHEHCNPAVRERGRQGSALYMAPEQVAGDSRLTSAVDTYGLGVLLYECLTLDTPCRGATKTETLRNVLQREPPPPRAAAGHGRVPPALEAACLRALDKQPHDRFATIADFRAALEDCRTDLLLDFERDSAAPCSWNALGAWNESHDAKRATERQTDGECVVVR